MAVVVVVSSSTSGRVQTWTNTTAAAAAAAAAATTYYTGSIYQFIVVVLPIERFASVLLSAQVAILRSSRIGHTIKTWYNSDKSKYISQIS